MTGPGAEGLVLDGVELWLGSRRLIGSLDLAIAPGQATTLMGPSGCGKSSLLAWIAGALDPAFHARGRVRVAGADVTALAPERRRLGLLYQDDLLFPHLSVGQNLGFGLASSIRGAARRQVIETALAEAGLEGFARRDPATLSGGQRARVALLRVLLAEPRALLLDEPFGKLDQDRRDSVRRFVFDHAVGRQLPVLLVTHDPADAAAAGGPVVRVG